MIAGFIKSTIPKNVGKLVSTASVQISKICTKISAAMEEDYTSAPNQKYPVSPNLFEYLPLTLFTSKAMKRLHQDPSSCLTKNISADTLSRVMNLDIFYLYRMKKNMTK
jgi:hypothetical protein